MAIIQTRVLVFGTGVNLTPSPQPHITGILAEPGWLNSLYLPMSAARGSIVICQMTGISGR